jgi:hypothetical protein
MVFASRIFLFLLLPLVLAAYFALPRRFGNSVLLLVSGAFCLWGEGIMLALVRSDRSCSTGCSARFAIKYSFATSTGACAAVRPFGQLRLYRR